MRIALDAMGSDAAPLPEVEGAAELSLTDECQIILVGDERKLRSQLSRHRVNGNLSIVHATEVVTMHDNPAVAVRKKKDASLLKALRLVKEGHADACVSAGNTGAVYLAARAILGPIPGVARSAICRLLPTLRKPVLLLDLGANPDCNARHLTEFAEMGSVYSQRALRVSRPRVGLLNIGEEEHKGNQLVKTVHQNLSRCHNINFIGNVEPGAIYEGQADVIVCDGFVGNVFLKTSEAAGKMPAKLFKRELQRSWLSKAGALMCLGAFKRLKNKVDANEYSGGMLLGVNGVAIILHGSCTNRGVINSIRGGMRAVDGDIIEHIRLGIQELRASQEQS
jgi:glycerol-3-phosphate acyltransferase PlsX